MKGYLSMFDLPERITAEYYDSIEMFTVESIWQLCDRDLSERKIDISSKEELSELCFDTGTVFPNRLQVYMRAVCRLIRHYNLKILLKSVKAARRKTVLQFLT